jgi:hypothetical protein
MKRKYPIPETLLFNSPECSTLPYKKPSSPDLSILNATVCDFLSFFFHTPLSLLLLALSLLGTPSPAIAQTPPPNPTALVRRAIQHRLDSAKNHPPHQYLFRRVDEHRDTTKAIIETPDGDVARLLSIDGKPLSPEADKAELDRLTILAQHPELQERRRKSEQKDADQVNHLLSLLPDAFVYAFAGTVPCAASQCTRLTFTPNPHFSPPDLAANIFRGIAGELWIDQAQDQLVKLDAHFIADVDFGFGILARLNEGSTALLEQSDVGGNDWELTTFNIHVTGKALLVRSFRAQVDQSLGHFTPVAPGLHYRDAITLLKQLDPSTPNAGLR